MKIRYVERIFAPHGFFTYEKDLESVYYFRDQQLTVDSNVMMIPTMGKARRITIPKPYSFRLEVAIRKNLYPKVEEKYEKDY